MSVLIVVSHPDDEVLGCGGTASGMAASGIRVRSCIMSGDADARDARPDLDELRSDTVAAQRVLGFDVPMLGRFPNIRLNTIPDIELVQFIESAIIEADADIIFTHHPNDVNSDHRRTSFACQAAARLFQRRPDVRPLKSLYFMEILSATDWALSPENRFQPDTFFEIGRQGLDRKLKALESYRGVMRDFPHPRSVEIVEGLAAYRGGQAGMQYAEAFQTAFHALGRNQ